MTRAIVLTAAMVAAAVLACCLITPRAGAATAGGEGRASAWAVDPVWHDGLAEKAVYAASRVVYGEPRAYEAVFFTNKEQHDRRTLTKAERSTDTLEVWKFNGVEVIPTPNYDYKYVTTAHLTVEGMQLTRLDCSSQEYCGTSFKQYLLTAWPGAAAAGAIDYFGFSYMPEAGRATAVLDSAAVVPADALPLWLRGYPFGAPGVKINLLPSQKSNHATDHKPLPAGVSYRGEDGDAYKLELIVDGRVAGTYWMAKDPAKRHVMLKYRGADGQQYDLKSVERVNYWTIKK